MKIFKLTAIFEDYESSAFIDIGLFLDRDVANDIKKKWESFFKEKKDIFKKPIDWNEEDEWTDSIDYYKLVFKYSYIKNFSEIEIKELELNEEIFLNSFKQDNNMFELMKQFDRDFKLNKII